MYKDKAFILLPTGLTRFTAAICENPAHFLFAAVIGRVKTFNISLRQAKLCVLFYYEREEQPPPLPTTLFSDIITGSPLLLLLVLPLGALATMSIGTKNHNILI